ncbi:hypothetical protein PIB30_098064 [Stylosanthes scabra]|uniref:Uncharacterized protein n=1 Tax=Stylosanthes scabra TaxID=79078 RepID=A0ABU6RXT0_9FABA|nr:hypothetical protein [Stylosanthes scabra]
MGSGVIYYQYERREKFKDYDTKANAELATFKISVRFDPDRPNEILSSTKDKKSSTRRSSSSRRPTPHYSPRSIPVAQRERSTSSIKGTHLLRRMSLVRKIRKKIRRRKKGNRRKMITLKMGFLPHLLYPWI